MKVLYLLLELKILLGVGRGLEGLELLLELDVVVVELLTLQPHLQRLQLLGGQLGGQSLGGQVVCQVLFRDVVVLKLMFYQNLLLNCR